MTCPPKLGSTILVGLMLLVPVRHARAQEAEPQAADAFEPSWMVGFNVTSVLKKFLASFLNEILN